LLGPPQTSKVGLEASIQPIPRRSLADWIRRLDAPSYYERIEAQVAIEQTQEVGRAEVEQGLRAQRLGVHGRMHAVWILTQTGDVVYEPIVFELAQNDSDPRIRANAVRALADLHDPVLREHRLAAGTDESGLAERLASLAPGNDPQVVREIAIAFGRLRWPG